MTPKTQKRKIEDFRSGDTVEVHYKIIEGEKQRIQSFEGVVISKRGEGITKTFTVRKIASGAIGVERIFPLHSPKLEKVIVIKHGKARRSKLYYLRKRTGSGSTLVKEKKYKNAADSEKPKP